MKFSIAIDFDRTLIICPNNDLMEYPIPVPKALEWVRRYQEKGSYIILHTSRWGKNLELAEKWCLDNGLKLDAVNRTHDEHSKPIADIYIDDKAFGVPKITFQGQRVVDWDVVGPEIDTLF